MNFSLTELQIIENIGKGLEKPKELALAIKKSPQQTNLSLNNLKNKGIINRKKGRVNLDQKTHAALLAKELIGHPNLKEILSGSGISVLSSSLEPLSANEIADRTGLKKSIIYRKIRQGINLSILRKKDKKYSINEKIWPELKKLLIELINYESTIDSRIPSDGIIYYKSGSGIVFSTRQDRDASLTAFSKYADFGISIFSTAKYYYLPKKKLSLKEIFMHSIYVADKSRDYRQLVYAALFYLKHKSSLKRIENSTLEILKKILRGEKIGGYPSLEDIKEKAEQYNLTISEE